MFARKSRFFALALSVALALGLAACTPSGGSTRSGATRSASHAPSPSATTTPGAAAGPTIVSGPNGMVSRAMVAENRRPGTTAWRIAGKGPGGIRGFADHNYAQHGDVVGLYVTTAQPDFTATAYRMGWYAGAGARQVWQSGRLTGTTQSACGVDRSDNMVSCSSWARSASMAITSAFVPGDYLIKLTASDDSQSYIQLTVWQPDSRASYLIMNRSMVEQGWNDFGGYDFYTGQGPCILDTSGYPPCNRARAVSFDRPYNGDGSNTFLGSEYPMVQFVEKEGLDVTYCTDICVSDHPAFLLQHHALLGLDHDETWTNSERVGVLNAAAAGVNMAFFGAATLVRHARMEPSALGPDRVEVDYRNTAEDPASHGGDPWQVTGNQWTSSPGGWNPVSFLGQLYSGYLLPNEPNAPMTVYDASSWLFQGTGLAAGATIPAVINSDIEHLDPSGPMPQNLQVLAHSPIPLSTVFTAEGRWNGSTFSDVTYYTNSAGAGIFDSGDNIWVATLADCTTGTANCPAPTMRRMTANVLKLFGQEPAGRIQPSQPNWHSVTPPGS